jgi:uncharacterized protein
MTISSSIWERVGTDSISRNLFILLYGFFTLAGFALTAIAAFYAQRWMSVEALRNLSSTQEIYFLLLVLLIFAIELAGIYLVRNSEELGLALIGYGLMAGSGGLLLGPLVELYTPASLVKVLFVVGLTVAVLMVIAAATADSLTEWPSILSQGLLVLLIGHFGIPLLALLVPNFPVHSALSCWEWTGVLIFSACFIYDMNKAMSLPATAGNAIRAALSLYLDIINIFYRILDATNDDPYKEASND